MKLPKLPKVPAGTVLGGLALFIALGGTAVAATGTIVNIADPNNASRVATVDSAGRLQVGGLITPRPPLAAKLWRAAGLGWGGECSGIGAPPAGQAVILRDLSVTVYNGPSSAFNGNTFVVIYANSTCSGPPVWDLMPTGNGTTTVDFDPGVGIPAGQALSVRNFSDGAFGVEVYAQGYVVGAGSVSTAVAPQTASDSRAPAGR